MKCIAALLTAAVTFASASMLQAQIVLVGGDGGGGGFMVQTEDAPVVVGWGGREGASYYIQNMDKAVSLTDQQKQTIKDIFDAREKAMQDFSTQNADKIKAASKAMNDAFKGGDADAITAAQENYQKLYEPMHKIMKKSSEDLNKVLTPEQNVKLQDYRAEEFIKSSTAPAKLNPDQIKQIKAAYLEAAKRGRGAEGVESPQQVVDRVLTADQKSQVTKGRLVSFAKMVYAGAKLTPEQSKKVEMAADELSKDPDVQPMELYSQLQSKVNELLTAEQKASMQGGWGAPGAPLGAQKGGAQGPALVPAQNPQAPGSSTR